MNHNGNEIEYIKMSLIFGIYDIFYIKAVLCFGEFSRDFNWGKKLFLVVD